MAINPTYDKTNKGTLRKNERKSEDWHPDYRGDVNVEGTDYWLDATLKQWPDGTRYMSLKLRPKEQRSDAPRPVSASAPVRSAIAGKGAASAAPIDDEIPF